MPHRWGGAAAGQRGTKKSSPAQPRDVDVELLKAVAQAWHAQSGNPRPSRASETGGDDSDAGARRREGAARRRPSRFKLEAMATGAGAGAASAPPREEAPWDFTQSLLDTYELVSVAKRLESGLVIADAGATAPDVARGPGRRGRESGRSLRSLFLRSSSRRFGETNS